MHGGPASRSCPETGPRAAAGLLHRGALLLAALVITLFGGCAPLSPLLPFHLTETTTVLQPRKFAFTAATGGGTLVGEGGAPGGAIRLRVGVGARQEVGIEGGMLYVDTGEPRGSSPPWIGKSSAYGAKLAWKIAPLPWLAVLAGAGASTSATGTAAGGDLALILSSDHPFGGWLRPYGALRGAFALPVGRDLDEKGGPTAALILPGGLSFQINRWVGLFLEFGGIFAWSSLGADPERYQQPVTAPSAQRAFEPSAHEGLYGAFGATFLLERNTDPEWYIRSLRIW